MSIEIRYTSKNKKRYKVRIEYKGKRVSSKTFIKRSDAILYERNALAELQKTGHIVDHSAQAVMTFSDALEKYKNEISINKKGYRQESYRIKALQEHKLAALTLINVRSKDIASFVKERERKGNSASTINKFIAIIEHLFNVARREWDMEGLNNPVANVTKPKVKNERTRRLVDNEESDLLTTCAQYKNIYLIPCIQFAIETAMRQGEILSIKLENIDYERRIVLLPNTKNGDSRIVPLSKKAISILKSLPQNSVIFNTTSRAIYALFKQACVAAKIKNLTFHDLRHEATSRLATKFQVHELAKITGHKDTRMLLRYYHPTAEDLVSKLD